MAARKMSDCRKTPSLANCTVKITGSAEEIVPLVLHHVTTAHGHVDTPALRDQLLAEIEDAPEDD